MKDKKDILISYSSKDFETAQEIAKTLEANGFTIWMAPRNIPGGSHYIKEIYDAIEESSIVLFIMSPNSMSSVWCSREVELGISQHKSLIPFQIKESKINYKDFKVFTTGVQIINGYQNAQKAMDELFKSLTRELNVSPREKYDYGGYISIAPPVSDDAALIHYLPEPHIYFGRTRDPEIEELKKLFENHRFVTVHGIGGQGKSELAKGFAQKTFKKNHYKKVHFATFTNNLKDTIRSMKFSGINEHMFDSDESLYAQKVELLNNETEKTLIIIDNCNVRLEDLEQQFTNPNINVLITSRRSDQKTGRLPLFGIGDQEEEEKLFFKNMWETSDEDVLEEVEEEEREQIREIIDLIGHHPLALELVAKAVDQSGIDYEEILEKLKHLGFRTDLEEELEIDYINHREGRIDDLIVTLFDENDFLEEEKKILRILSLAPVEGLPQKKLKELAELKNLNMINNLIKGSWIIKERQHGNSFRLHPLIQKVIYTQLKPNQNNTGSLYKKLEEESLKQISNSVPYLERQTTAQMIDKASYSFETIEEEDLDLVLNFVYALYQSNYYDQAKRLLKLLEDIRRRKYEENPSNENLYKLNETYIIQGRIEYQLQRTENIKRSLEFFDKVNVAPFDLTEENYLFQAIDYNSYRGWALYQNHEPEKANILFDQEEELFKRAQNIKDQRAFDLKRANYLYNNSVTLYNVRDLDKAYQRLKEALEIYENYYKSNHPRLTSSLNEMGYVELSKGNTADAYNLFKLVLEIRLENLGENHSHTATAFHNIAVAALQLYILTGDNDYLEKADELVNKALKIRRVLLPNTPIYGRALLDRIRINIELLKKEVNPDLLNETGRLLEESKRICSAYERDLSDYFEVEGDYLYFKEKKDEALNSYDRSLEIRRKLLRPEHEKLVGLEDRVNYIRSLDEKH